MKYLKSWLVNFLTIFFANYVLPGIIIAAQTKLPHIGGDILFALVLAGLNTLVYPALKIFSRNAPLSQIAIIIIALNFLAYALLKFLPLGIQLTSIEGYLLGSLAASLAGFFTNYYERKLSLPPPTDPPMMV